MKDNNSAARRGYLNENYRLFYLKDKSMNEVEHHYHEFDKVVLFYSGSADYLVEGVTYHLMPGDVLFIRHHDIHKPLVSADVEYERAILWISPAFLNGGPYGDINMEQCFSLSSQSHACLYKPGPETRAKIRYLVTELEKASKSDEFASGIMADTYFLQLIIELNRCVINDCPETPKSLDGKMDETIKFINSNLSSELSVERLASMCCLSRYYFMRRFKEATGYTVHGYVQQKRLARAAELLMEGMPVAQAASKVGFDEYSSFLRAFRKSFNVTPTEFASSANGFSDPGFNEQSRENSIKQKQFSLLRYIHANSVKQALF